MSLGCAAAVLAERGAGHDAALVGEGVARVCVDNAARRAPQKKCSRAPIKRREVDTRQSAARALVGRAIALPHP
ncbi:hypothetical protein [Nannocystis pusilla]|uniref:Uncharacterized protein n=1 Tax=Nannocystis pusilla TaxID=889268 RepID=A0ABS7TU11_9BACT|nr:hypothetical protein [Nannocystis pusilla]MBZ5711694.1 hypothetical protein [Nannocystis pusilla]